MKNGSTPFDLSVVIPLDDDHGFGEACVESWNAQTHPRTRLQLVVLDPGNQPDLIDRIRPRLSAHDLLVRVTTDNEGLLYERGADAAEAELLFMTEGHCIAEPHAAAEILSLFQDPEVAAVNGAATHIGPTIIARQQTLLELEWLAAWPPGHSRTISLRAFALRREIYQRLGRFRPEYRRFCANALAVELERRCLRLAPTRVPIVRHCNSLTISDVAVTLRDCARGQIVWRAELDGNKDRDTADRYLGRLEFWSQRSDLEPRSARLLASALVRSIFADLRRPGSFQKTRHSFATLPRLVAGSLLGPRASAWAQRLALGWAMLVCSAARVHKIGLFNSYRRLWSKSFDSGFADYVAEHRSEPKWITLVEEPVSLAAFPDEAVAGFYAREPWGPAGPLMRWSGCVFLLRFCLVPGRSHRITFHIHSVVPYGERCLTAFLNGSALPQNALHEEAEQLVVLLPNELCRPDGRQDLVCTCRAMRPSERGEPDRRRLGLAVFTVKLDSKPAA